LAALATFLKFWKRKTGMMKMKMKIMASATLVFSITLASGQQALAANDMADMPGMDHGSMSMKGGGAPADARDPHAYSDGYNFDQMRPHEMADEVYMGGLLVDRLERAHSRDNSFNAYDLQSWLGKDYNKLVLKAEGEGEGGKLQEARTELLWGHAQTTYWDTQLGLRYDSGIAPDRRWLALGVQGLAPYWFEVDAAAYIGEQGRTALRLSAEYELLLTQKLILQPRIEADFYGQQDTARELGSGLSSLITGVRLRYEIRREFAPYVGVEWGGKFGGTADYARAAGMRTKETRVVAGVRFWY
jgi:copper resistance protein B